MPPSHPRSPNQDSKEPKESHQIGAGCAREAPSKGTWSVCRTACTLAQFKQPLEWQLVIHASPLLPARPRHDCMTSPPQAAAATIE